jgi:hypothetical protein
MLIGNDGLAVIIRRCPAKAQALRSISKPQGVWINPGF